VINRDFDWAKVHIEIVGDFDIAPIDLHYLIGNLTELLKVLSELERNGGNRRNIITKMNVDYIPVRDKE